MLNFLLVLINILRLTCGDDSSSINSTSTGFIQIQASLKETYRLKVGDRVRLECEFKSNAPIEKLYWLKNLEELIQPKKNRIFITRKNASIVLILKKINVFDKGSYSCFAENKYGIAESETSIFVQDDEQEEAYVNRRKTNMMKQDDYLAQLNDLIEPDSEPPTLNPTIIESDDPHDTSQGKCEPYRGQICAQVFYTSNYSIYSLNDKQQFEIETKLKQIMPLIHTIPQSKAQCNQFILSSLCLIAFPLCDSSFGVPRPRQICRSDCVKLQYDVCLNEYIQIKSLFNAQDGLMLECNQLPPSSDIQTQCISPIQLTLDRLIPKTNQELVIKDSNECIVGNGADYSGRQSYSLNGRRCLIWSNDQHNYCRNLNNDLEPWCLVHSLNGLIQKEYCGITKCLVISRLPLPTQQSTTMSLTSLLYIIIPSVCLPLGILTIYLIMRVCKTSERSEKSTLPTQIPNYYQTQSKYSLNSLASKSARSSSDYSDVDQRRITRANSTKTSTLLSSSAQSNKKFPLFEQQQHEQVYYEATAPKSIYDMVK